MPYKCKHPKCQYVGRLKNEIRLHEAAHDAGLAFQKKPSPQWDPALITIYYCPFPNCLYRSDRSNNVQSHFETHRCKGKRRTPSGAVANVNSSSRTNNNSSSSPSTAEAPICTSESTTNKRSRRYLGTNALNESHSLVNTSLESCSPQEDKENETPAPKNCNRRTPTTSYTSSISAISTDYTSGGTEESSSTLEVILLSSSKETHKCTHEACDFKTQSKSSLQRHLATHSGGKKYPCTFDGCKYAATQRSDLRRHQATHTGEKPYKCDVPGCNYAASRSDAVYQHKRGVHKCDSAAITCTVVSTGNKKSSKGGNSKKRKNSSSTTCRDTSSSKRKKIKNTEDKATGYFPCLLGGCDYIAKKKGTLYKHVRCKHPKPLPDIETTSTGTTTKKRKRYYKKWDCPDVPFVPESRWGTLIGIGAKRHDALTNLDNLIAAAESVVKETEESEIGFENTSKRARIDASHIVCNIC